MEASSNASVDSLSLDLADILSPGRDLVVQKQRLDAAIEEMLAKLEEFRSLMEMMCECGGAALSEAVPRAFLARQQLQQLFCRIDAMSQFVRTADSQLSRLELQLSAAEKQLGSSGTISHAVSSLFQKKRSEMNRQEASVQFSPVDIFQTDDYFHQRFPPASEQE